MSTVIDLSRKQIFDAQPRTMRICLGCDSAFSSTGPGNRICNKCSETNSHKAMRVGRGATRSRGKGIGQ